MQVRLSTARILAVCLLFVLLGCFCIHRIIDVDIWWHLKAGQYIVSTRTVPQHDLFSHTSADHPWIDLHWLYQVLVYLVYRWAGGTGLLLLKSLVVLSTFALLFRTALQRAGILAVIIPTLFAALAFERYLPRPEIFTELLVAVYLFILFSFKYRGSRLVFALPLLQIVWVNTEGLFILGVVIVAAFTVGEWLVWKLPWPSCWREPDAVTGRRWWMLFWVAVTCALACFLNPYGVKGALFPFTLYTRLGRGADIFSATIAELSPPPFFHFSTAHPPLFFYNLLAAVSVLSFVTNIRRLSVSRLLVFGSFLFLSVLARRNIPLFACVAVPVTAFNLGEFWSDIRARWVSRFGVWAEGGGGALSGILIVVLAGLIWSVTTNRFSIRNWPLAEFGVGFSPYMYPVKAADFIEQAGLSGNMFNNIGIGGYLCWRGYPERKVFIDGRLEVHEREFYTEYIRVMQNPVYWNDLARRYDIDYVVLQHTMGDTQALIGRLHRQKNWALVYVDDVSVVFVRDTVDHREIVERYRPLAEQALARRLEAAPQKVVMSGSGGSIFRRVEIPFDFLHRGTILAELGFYDEAAAMYREALDLRPDLAMIRYDLALVCLHQRHYDEAIENLLKALDLDPFNPAMLDSLGYAYDKKGDREQAEIEFRRAVRADPKYLKARYDLAHVLMARGRMDEARNEAEIMLGLHPDQPRLHGLLAEIHLARQDYGQAFDESWKAVRLDDRYAEGFNLVGSASRRLGRYDDAVAAYARALALDENDVTARNNLGVCFAQMGRYKDAREQWESALRIQPTNTGIRANLDRLLRTEKGER